MTDVLARDPNSTCVIYRRKENFTWFPLLKNLIKNQNFCNQLGFSVSNTRRRGLDMKKA
jgi:hypothetical protein